MDRQPRTEIMVARRRIALRRSGKFNLAGQPALRIGEWQGDPVGWCARIAGMRWDRYARVLDQDAGLFNSRGAGSSWRSFIDRTNSAATAGIRCIPAKPNGRCFAATAANVITANRPASSSPSAGMTLFAGAAYHRNGVHTVLAGFVEVGETRADRCPRGDGRERH